MHQSNVATKSSAFPFQSGPSRRPDLVTANQRTTNDGMVVRNRILMALPQTEFNSLRPAMDWIRLTERSSLLEPGDTLDYAYFPNRGLVSRVVVMKDGKTVEVGIIGEEGLVGAEGISGLGTSPHRLILYNAGDGARVRIDVLRSLLPMLPQFQLMLNRHVVLQSLQGAQWAACNRLHTAEQRLARWLLTMHDRTEDESLRVTHDFLASMLGTDRPSVSLAAGLLQKREAITYSRGTIKVLDRQRLEESVCECHEVMQRLNDPPILP